MRLIQKELFLGDYVLYFPKYSRYKLKHSKYGIVTGEDSAFGDSGMVQSVRMIKFDMLTEEDEKHRELLLRKFRGEEVVTSRCCFKANKDNAIYKVHDCVGNELHNYDFILCESMGELFYGLYVGSFGKNDKDLIVLLPTEQLSGQVHTGWSGGLAISHPHSVYSLIGQCGVDEWDYYKNLLVDCKLNVGKIVNNAWET